MSRVDTALEELVAAIIESPEYRKYDGQVEILREHPDLKNQIDAYREENFAFQKSANPDELFDKIDEFSKKFEEFRKNPMVESFLAAELDFCRMIQHINQRIVEAVKFE